VTVPFLLRLWFRLVARIDCGGGTLYGIPLRDLKFRFNTTPLADDADDAADILRAVWWCGVRRDTVSRDDVFEHWRFDFDSFRVGAPEKSVSGTGGIWCIRSSDATARGLTRGDARRDTSPLVAFNDDDNTLLLELPLDDIGGPAATLRLLFDVPVFENDTVLCLPLVSPPRGLSSSAW